MIPRKFTIKIIVELRRKKGCNGVYQSKLIDWKSHKSINAYGYRDKIFPILTIRQQTQTSCQQNNGNRTEKPQCHWDNGKKQYTFQQFWFDSSYQKQAEHDQRKRHPSSPTIMIVKHGQKQGQPNKSRNRKRPFLFPSDTSPHSWKIPHTPNNRNNRPRKTAFRSPLCDFPFPASL